MSPETRLTHGNTHISVGRETRGVMEGESSLVKVEAPVREQTNSLGLLSWTKFWDINKPEPATVANFCTDKMVRSVSLLICLLYEVPQHQKHVD